MSLKLTRMKAVLLCMVLACQGAAAQGRSTRLTSYVDPFIGADGGGNTVPGAAVPFGFANPSPDTLHHETSGYDSAQPISGFSQTHVSGTGGGSKYGNFRITPQVGEINLEDLASPKAMEHASPGYYSVVL